MGEVQKLDQGVRTRSIGGFVTLTKPGLTFVSVSTAVGSAFLGLREPMNYFLLLHVFIGAYLAGAGAGALNQYMERDSDSRMTRTGLRPLPSRRLPYKTALYFGMILALLGILYLVFFTTSVAGVITIATLIIYLAFYTPMKRKTPAALYIGGVAGALPPLIGWTAVGMGITPAGLSLFLILFLWQIPHFLSLAWIYKEDYRRAGYNVGPVTDPSGTSAGWQILIASFLLIPVALLPASAGIAGAFYIVVAPILSILFFLTGLLFFRQRTEKNARRLFMLSISYIPILFVTLVIDSIVK